MLLQMGSLIMYIIPMKWLWNPHVKKLAKKVVGMDVHKIVEQMWKTNLQNEMKIVILEKWLTMTSNWRRYERPFVTPPNLGANLTSLKRHEPLFHTHHESLHQTNED
jgi:hypothetical protein